MHSQAGDVIAICPDGWAWSEAELTNPDWRIVRAPLLPIECVALLASSLPEALVKRRRMKRLALAADSRIATFMAKTRARGEIIDVTRQQVNKIVKVLT
jgi:hypothetical protein